MTKIEVKFFPGKVCYENIPIIQIVLGSRVEYGLSIPQAKLLAKKLEKALGRAGK